MSLRLPLSGLLLALASLALADGASDRAIPFTGLAVGIALAITVVLDALRSRRAPQGD